MEDEEDTEVVIDLCIADTQMEGTSVVVEEISVSYASAVHLSEQPAAAIGLNDQANNEQGIEAINRIFIFYVPYFSSRVYPDQVTKHQRTDTKNSISITLRWMTECTMRMRKKRLE